VVSGAVGNVSSSKMYTMRSNCEPNRVVVLDTERLYGE
jgi:hypothetical protein